MKRNSRLSLALHTLGHMAHDPDRVQTSAEIAHHAGTNPVVVRRVLGKLRQAGLLRSEKGHSGGWQLTRDPQRITVADVYLALEERLVASGMPADPSDCCVEHMLHRRVSSVLDVVEQALVAQLADMTIAEVQASKDCACTRCREPA